MMNINILLRFDDICPTMNWKQWNKVMSLLEEKGEKALLGVIPDNKDPDLMIDKARPDFWDYIRRLQMQGFTIAMHGYQHVFTSPNHGLLNYRMNSEFAGLPLEDQITKIRRGKEILESHGIHTDVFFAPAHSYDENTLIALNECGFNYMSDGKSKKAYIWHGIKCLPFRNSGAATIKGNGYYTSVFHAHEWDMPEKKHGFSQFCKVLNSDNVVSFDDYIKQPCGDRFFQLTCERLFVWWQGRIRQPLSMLKRKIIH